MTLAINFNTIMAGLKIWDRSKIVAGLYVMQSLLDPTVFRAGAIGIQGKKNTAAKRLKQVNCEFRPWDYTYILPIAANDELLPALIRAEIIFQGNLYVLGVEFLNKKSRFRCGEVDTLLKTAHSSAVLACGVAGLTIDAPPIRAEGNITLLRNHRYDANDL